MRLNEPPATRVALEDKIAVRGCTRMEEKRAEEWNEFYEKELDALEWAKEFMNKYESKRSLQKRKKNAVLAAAESQNCRINPELRDLPSSREESLGESPEKLSEKDTRTTNKIF